MIKEDEGKRIGLKGGIRDKEKSREGHGRGVERREDNTRGEGKAHLPITSSSTVSHNKYSIPYLHQWQEYRKQTISISLT